MNRLRPQYINVHSCSLPYTKHRQLFPLFTILFYSNTLFTKHYTLFSYIRHFVKKWNQLLSLGKKCCTITKSARSSSFFIAGESLALCHVHVRSTDESPHCGKHWSCQGHCQWDLDCLTSAVRCRWASFAAPRCWVSSSFSTAYCKSTQTTHNRSVT